MYARHPGVVVVIAALLLAIAADPSGGQIPPKFNYQGILKDASGVPMPDGTYPMTFSLWNAETGGSDVWGETQSVPVVNGVFSVVLGEVKPLAPVTFDRPYWLGVAVDGEPEMVPRIPLSSTPYAFQSVTVVDDAITGPKIDDGHVVRSLNGLTDDVELIAGSNVTIAPLGNDLIVSATGGTGADNDWTISGDDLIMIPVGDVGIGTTTPVGVSGHRALHIADSMQPSLTLEQTGTPYARWTLWPSGLLGSLVVSHSDMTTGTGEILVNVLSNGHVGIGDLLPSARLSVLGGVADLGTYEGDLRVGTSEYRLRIGVDTDGNYAGDARIWATGGSHRLILGSNDHDVAIIDDEELRIYTADGDRTAILSGRKTTADIGGQLQLLRPNGIVTLELDANEDGDGSNAAVMLMTTSTGTRTVYIEGQENSGTQGSQITMYDYDGNETIEIDADWGSNGGAGFAMRSVTGTPTIVLDAMENDNPTQGGTVKLYNGAGELTIELDADWGGIAEGRIITEVLEITGGADLSEQFEVNAAESAVQPGTVLCIDTERPGELTPSRRAYDCRVAGVVSGAGGVRPGMLMGHSGTVADGEHPVALSGRVYVRADATPQPIRPGDLLTTSGLEGHAMKVVDHERSNGAILGKAMTSLDEGQGLVLVLVSLQ